MKSLFSEMRKLGKDVLSIVRSPTKMGSLLRVSLYSNAIYLMLATLTNALFGFIFWIIAARLYTTEVVGITSAIISAAALLEQFCFLGLDYGLIRFLKSSNNPFKLINSAITLTALLSLAAAGIFIIGLGIWAPGLMIIRENYYYLIIFILYVPILVLDDLTDDVMMGGRQAKFIFLHYIIFNILRLALLVFMVAFFRSFGIFGFWTTAMFIALLASVFLLVPRTQRGYHFRFIIDRKELSEVMHFSFLNYLSSLLGSMPSLVLPIIVVNLLGAKSNAYFYMAWSVSSVLNIVPTSVAYSLLAEGTYDQAKLKIHVRRSFKIAAVLLIPVIVLVWFLVHKLLSFYGSLYAENGATLLRWLAIAAFPAAINIIYFSIKRVQKNVKPVILLGALMSVITILMSYLLIPRWGINGIGIACLTAQSLIALIVIMLNMKHHILRMN